MKIEKSRTSSSVSSMENRASTREHIKSSSIEVFEPTVGNNVERHLPAEVPQVSFSTAANRKPVNAWMAFEDNTSCNFKMSSDYSCINDPNGGSFQGKENYDDNGSNGTNSLVDEGQSGNSLERLAPTWGKSFNGSGSGEFSRVSEELKDALAALEQQIFVVCDAGKLDCPIVYASSGFFTMSGYSSEEVIGKNRQFLQGPKTSQIEVTKTLTALRTRKSYCGRQLNYKKDGTPFWNLLTISPITLHDIPNTLYFVGMKVEVKECVDGVDDVDLLSNWLPGPLVLSDASRKEAKGHARELMKTVQYWCSNVWDASQVVKEEMEKLNFEFVLPNSAELEALSMPGGEVTKCGSVMEMSSTPEAIASSWSLKKSMSSLGKPGQPSIKPEILMTKEIEQLDSWDQTEREGDIHQGINLACALELIEKKFVITDPRLPDNPIIYASDSFLKVTEYTRKEVLGRNYRFLQGPQSDQATVSKIRDAMKEQKEITVQLINYTKSGKKSWNLFHWQPVYNQKGQLQYFIGVQLDGNDRPEFLLNCVSEERVQESAKNVKATAEDVDKTICRFPDAVLRPRDLLALHSVPVFPQPHKRETASWIAIKKITARGEKIGLHHFNPVKPLGCGDTGSVHLVQLKGTGELFAMKAMKKSTMLNRNKVHRACIERNIMSKLDHPFSPTLYASFQTSTHVCLITDFFPGGDLFVLLDKQPMKILKEEYARFYAAEVVICLEYLHSLGIIYRDLKPENILLQQDGHIVLTDFDLSFLTSCEPQIVKPLLHAYRRSRSQLPPMCIAEPGTQSISFVGTEEYIAPEVITGGHHTSSMDWWALGILLYEMLYGQTPYKGKSRKKTFANILHKDLTFPSRIRVSLAARQLIDALLQKDPTSRLGSISGANEIKQHSFFQGISWPLIRCMSPPPLDMTLQTIQKDPNPNEML